MFLLAGHFPMLRFFEGKGEYILVVVKEVCGFRLTKIGESLERVIVYEMHCGLILTKIQERVLR